MSRIEDIIDELDELYEIRDELERWFDTHGEDAPELLFEMHSYDREKTIMRIDVLEAAMARRGQMRKGNTMTTAFQSEQYYTADEWEIIVREARVDYQINYDDPYVSDIRTASFFQDVIDKSNMLEAVKRHNIPLNIDGYTSPENGCHLCGKAMHYTELDKLAERGLPPDTCLRCHHNDECPTCHGTGEVSTGRRLLSHDWHDAPEYDTSRCEDCNGCGDYDSYCVVNGKGTNFDEKRQVH